MRRFGTRARDWIWAHPRPGPGGGSGRRPGHARRRRRSGRACAVPTALRGPGTARPILRLGRRAGAEPTPGAAEPDRPGRSLAPPPAQAGTASAGAGPGPTGSGPGVDSPAGGATSPATTPAPGSGSTPPAGGPTTPAHRRRAAGTTPSPKPPRRAPGGIRCPRRRSAAASRPRHRLDGSGDGRLGRHRRLRGRPFTDGAAFDPVTRSWRKLPAAPLSSRYDARAFWTGREMIVFGGISLEGDVLGDGAAWDPAANRWRASRPRRSGPATARSWPGPVTAS